MKVLYIIPARGGSKGIPRKNIKPLAGKPLLYYTIDAARKVADDTDICVSTDDDEIIRFAESYGLQVPFKRPEVLATDQARTYDVLLHAVEFYEQRGRSYDVIVLLQPTSPFRTDRHIREALELYTNGIDMVMSVTETKSNPYYVLFEEDQQGFLSKSKSADFTRRQDSPKVWEANGAVYVINVHSLKTQPLHKYTKIKKYVMGELESCDLDTLLDWKFAEFLMNDPEDFLSHI